jgi:hypothetical protein
MSLAMKETTTTSAAAHNQPQQQQQGVAAETSPLLLFSKQKQQRPSNSSNVNKNHTSNVIIDSPKRGCSSSIVYANSTLGSPCSNSLSSRGRRRRRRPQATTTATTATSTIPTSLRWTTNASSLLSALLFTGIIFGWAPLKLLLMREGQYQELCIISPTTPTPTPATTTSPAASTTTTTSSVVKTAIFPCVSQLDRFNRIFTLAQFALSFGSLPVGFLLDHTPSITIYYSLAAVFQVGGLILFGLSESSSRSSSDNNSSNRNRSSSYVGLMIGDYFVVAYSGMAIGGCMTMLGAFPASFLLPRHQPAILAAISCLFDASSIVFAIFNRLNQQQKYNNNEADVPFSRRRLFLAYAVVAIFIYALLSYCWASIEKHDWKSIVEAESSQAATTTNTSVAAPKYTKDDNKVNKQQQQQQEPGFDDDEDPHSSSSRRVLDGSISGNGDGDDDVVDDSHLLLCRRRGMHEWSLSQQLQTLEFLLVLVFASVHMLRCNFYIETVNEILASIAKRNGDNHENADDDDAAVVYANIFSFVLPVGIVFVPLIETTVRRWGIVHTLHLTNALGIAFGALLLVPSLYVQAFNFLVFTCFRAYLYATLNTFIALTFVSFFTSVYNDHRNCCGHLHSHHFLHSSVCFSESTHHRVCRRWVA